MTDGTDPDHLFSQCAVAIRSGSDRPDTPLPRHMPHHQNP